MKEKIIEILKKELGYSDHVAGITADDLLSISTQLKPALSKWLEKREITNLEVSGLSIKQLMERRGYTFPSALISMDWLLTEPEVAKRELLNEVRR
jgi:hypothetical protein